MVDCTSLSLSVDRFLSLLNSVYIMLANASHSHITSNMYKAIRFTRRHYKAIVCILRKH